MPLRNYFLTVEIYHSPSHGQGHHSHRILKLTKKAIEARADTSLLQADCDSSSVFRIREYLLRVALTAGKRTSHRVGQSGLTLHAGAVDAMALPGSESDDAIFEKNDLNFSDE